MRALLASVALLLAVSGCAVTGGPGQPGTPPPIVGTITDAAAQVALREALKPACGEFYAQVRLNSEASWPESLEDFLNQTEDQGFAICRKLIASGQPVLATDPLDVVQINESLEETRKAIRAGLI